MGTAQRPHAKQLGDPGTDRGFGVPQRGVFAIGTDLPRAADRRRVAAYGRAMLVEDLRKRQRLVGDGHVGVPHVGVFRDESPQRVVEIVNTIGLRAAQLHGHETVEQTIMVRSKVPFVIKGFPAGDPEVSLVPIPQTSELRNGLRHRVVGGQQDVDIHDRLGSQARNGRTADVLYSAGETSEATLNP